MFWTLLRKELLTHLLTLRLAIVLGCAVVLTGLTVVIGSLDYEQNWGIYKGFEADAQDDLENVRVYQQLGHLRWFIPPEPLSLLCRGSTQASALTSSFGFEYVAQVPSPLGAAENDRLLTLSQVDFVQVIALLLSFLAVVLGYDGICGEAERGTLTLLLSHPVSRGTVLAAKLSAGLLALWLPLAIAFCLALMIALSNPVVQLTSADWIRAALLFCLSCLFLAQVYVLALMVSASTRSSATALIVCLFIWLATGVGLPSALVSLSRYGVKETPYPVYLVQRGKLWERLEATYDEWEARNPKPAPAYQKGHERDGVIRYARPEYYEWRSRQQAFWNPLVAKLATDSDKMLTAGTTDPHIRQSLLIEDLSILSPFSNYVTIAKMLTRTSAHDRVAGGVAGRRFRADVVRWLEGRGAYGDRRWFTDDPEDQEPMISDPEAVTEEMLVADSPFMQDCMAWVERQEDRAAGDGRRHLDLSDFPRVRLEWQASIARSLSLATPGILVLLLTTGLSVLVAVNRFLRRDLGA